jgi:alanine racemase
MRRYAAGETVGYGRGGVLQRDTEVATLRVGYADGYDRRLGFGKGRVWVRGQFAPTLGSICMDMCMVDVTGFGVQVGDTVELLGEAVSVREWAEAMQTIPYEVLTQIGQRVPRVYVG